MITFSNKKSIGEVAKGVVPVRLVDGDETSFVETKAGSRELRIGVGTRENITRRKYITLVRKIIRTSKVYKLGKIAVFPTDFEFPQLEKMPRMEFAHLFAENMEMANFEFSIFKSEKNKPHLVTEVVIVGVIDAESKEGLRRGQIVGSEVNGSRALANMPAGDMTPAHLAEEAKKAAKGLPIKVTILNEKEIEKLKMGALLGVARGSTARPKFIVMEYWGAGEISNRNKKKVGGAHGVDKDNPIVFVGKGVTFDSGGINMKPDQSSLGMHMDMSGGAACIHSIVAAARLKIKKNIITLVPAVENMVSGESYRPGDVLRSMSGITIDVLHTDAEGRLILADALTYAERYRPALVVDVATLTGGAIAALGLRASAILTKDEKLEKQFRELGEATGEYVWPLPLWEEYEADIKGVFGDIANVPQKPKGGASTINGGTFLYQFAKKYPWVHIDIASRMETIPEDELAQGSAGAPVRLLVRVAEELK